MRRSRDRRRRRRRRKKETQLAAACTQDKHGTHADNDFAGHTRGAPQGSAQVEFRTFDRSGIRPGPYIDFEITNFTGKSMTLHEAAPSVISPLN
ncbi:hypothetical protein BST61_g8633 [Cercospora zeina]